MGKIELEEKKFWVLVGKNLCLYSDKQEAILGLKEVLPKQPDATIAEISYGEKGDKGTFNVEGMSWKEIALGWLPVEEKEEE